MNCNFRTINSFLCDESLIQLYENLAFNQNSFVESFDEQTFDFETMKEFEFGGQSIFVEVIGSSRIQDYSIIRYKNGRAAAFLVKNDQNFYDFLAKKTLEQATLMELYRGVLKEISIIQQVIRNPEPFSNELKKKIHRESLKLVATSKADDIARTLLFRQWDLSVEMQECGLSPENIALIEKHGAGTYNISDFLKFQNLGKKATVIGLNHKKVIEGVVCALECDSYIEAYQRIFNSIFARPDFVERLTSEENPVIFLVPHKLFGNKRGFTAGEMDWLLTNYKSMEKVHFVFGAYKSYTQKILAELEGQLEANELETYQESLTERVFIQVRQQMTLPSLHPDAEMHEVFGRINSIMERNLKPFDPLRNFSKLNISSVAEVDKKRT